MKFQVIGSNRETGARMMLELDAESKAAAERKATQSGMSVSRVVDISDGYPAYANESQPARRRGGRGGRLLSLIVLAAIIFAVWHFWPQVQQMIHK